MSGCKKIASKRKSISSDDSDEDDLKSHVSFIDETSIQKRARIGLNYLDHLERSRRCSTSGCSSLFHCLDIKKPYILISKEGKSSPTSLAINSSGTHLYSTNSKGALTKWSMKKKKKVASLSFTKRNKINHVAISCDDRYVAISDCKGNIQIWTADIIKRIKILPGNENTITGLIFHPSAHILYSIGIDKVVNIWCLKKMRLIHALRAHMEPITCIDTLNSDIIITGGCDQKVIVWKVPEERHVIFMEHSSAVLAVKFIKDDYFISGDMNGKLIVWHLYRRNSLCCIDHAHGCNTDNRGYSIHSIVYVEDEDIIVTGSNDKYLKLWKISFEQKIIFCAHKVRIQGFINDLITTKCGTCLIAAVGKAGKNSIVCNGYRAQNYIFIIPIKIFNK